MNQKVLLYLASGRDIRAEYFQIPFENVYLFDKAIRSNEDINNVIARRGECSSLLKRTFGRNNQKIDCVVVINEGLNEGGGSYSLLYKGFFSLLMPYLNDDCILITTTGSYYNQAYSNSPQETLFDIPYDFKQIKKESIDYINKDIFSDYGHSTAVYKMSRKESSVFCRHNTQEKINYSIWEDYNDLDVIFMNYYNKAHIRELTGARKVNSIVESKGFIIPSIKPWFKKLFIIDNNATDGIIKLCRDKGFNKIGFMDLFNPYRCLNNQEIETSELNYNDIKQKFIDSDLDYNLTFYKY